MQVSIPAISDMILKTVVGTRLEAGVNAADIWSLIDRFAADEKPAKAGNDDLVGFLEIEDIPQHCREAFLVEIAKLPTPPPGGGIASVQSLQMAIDRLKEEHQAALDADALEHAHGLLAETERLEAQKREILRRIARVVPWRDNRADN